MLRVASEAINYGRINHKPPSINLSQYAEIFRETRATFVTLEINNQLRGCIGSLMGYRPLLNDIASNAFVAAFKDPRFSPVTTEEIKELEIHISILSPAEDMSFDSEHSLIEQLRPNIDGLIIMDKEKRATFLPSVWESSPNPALFLSELKQKAGFNQNYWSKTFSAQRYTTFSFGQNSLWTIL